MATGGSRKDWEITVLRHIEMSEFAVQVFKYLCFVGHIGGFPNDYETKSNNADVVFTKEIGKAIISLGYTFRVSFRKKFMVLKDRLKHVRNFKNFIKGNTVQTGKNYFLNFLTWIALAFDLTMYLRSEGCDFIAESLDCVANYPDINYFHEVGGWVELEKVALPLSHGYDKLSVVMNRELPENEKVEPLLKVVKDVVTLDKELRKKFDVKTPEMRFVRELKKRLSSKYTFVTTLDPRIVTTGYKVVRKNIKQSRKDTKEPAVLETKQNIVSSLPTHIAKSSISIEAVESETPFSGKGAECSAISTESDPAESTIIFEIAKISEHDPYVVDETKVVFLIKACFLAKLAEMKDKDAKNQAAIKIISPANRIEDLSEGLTKVLYECIKNKHYEEIVEDILVAGPPGCDVEDDDNRLVVLGTSSDKEHKCDIIFDEMQTLVEEFSSYIISENINITSSEAETKVEENLMEHSEAKLPEQSEFLPGSSTGAISKVKPYVHQTDEASPMAVDEELLGKNQEMDPSGNDDVQKNKPNSKKKKQKRKKSSRK